jgi:hypothetical protein
MTIVEFLEARITEDEHEARGLQQEMDFGLEGCGDRMLAECAAKRFILAMHKTYSQVASERTGIAAFGAECGRDVTADVLKPLAAVYSSHPDYDEDWAL